MTSTVEQRLTEEIYKYRSQFGKFPDEIYISNFDKEQLTINIRILGVVKEYPKTLEDGVAGYFMGIPIKTLDILYGRNMG